MYLNKYTVNIFAGTKALYGRRMYLFKYIAV